MDDISERFARVAGRFTERVEGVDPDGWERPAPCEGWVARDVIRHLVEWVPGLLFDSWALARPVGPSVEDDPAGAWTALCDALAAGLDDPAIAAKEADIRPGRYTWAAAVDQFVVGDLVVHTWDLARATGQDEALDPVEVHRMYEGLLPMDEVLRQSGHYGPKVEVPDGADEQTKLLAFTGRRP